MLYAYAHATHDSVPSWSPTGTAHGVRSTLAGIARRTARAATRGPVGRLAPSAWSVVSVGSGVVGPGTVVVGPGVVVIGPGTTGVIGAMLRALVAATAEPAGTMVAAMAAATMMVRIRLIAFPFTLGGGVSVAPTAACASRG